MSNIIRRVIRHYFSKSNSLAENQSVPEEALLRDEIAGYDTIIGQHIPFFNQLKEQEKRRFMTRVYHFKSAKTFTYHGLEANQEIPVLISAAAVQLTFGLRKYKLTYFKNIIVTSDAYTIPDFTAPIIGHVSPKGIYLSWKHFLEGYNNSEDNVNVAIHEMAHALEYENFLSGAGIDWEFRKDLEKFYAQAGPHFAKVLMGKPTYLRKYAYSNMREFWAVTAEAFFENPQAFRNYMPELYTVVCEVLNQNPLSRCTEIVLE